MFDAPGQEEGPGRRRGGDTACPGTRARRGRCVHHGPGPAAAWNRAGLPLPTRRTCVASPAGRSRPGGSVLSNRVRSGRKHPSDSPPMSSGLRGRPFLPPGGPSRAAAAPRVTGERPRRDDRDGDRDVGTTGRGARPDAAPRRQERAAAPQELQGGRSTAPLEMAERTGFEPAIRFPVYALSKRAPSTTRPPLRAWVGCGGAYPGEHGGAPE